MAKLSLVYVVSAALHGALAVGLISLKEPTRSEVIAISMAESKERPKADPPKPVDPPKASIETKAAAPRAPSRAKAATEPKPAAAPVPAAAPPTNAAPSDGLPDFGLTLSNGGGPGGMAVPSGGGPAAGPIAAATSAPRAARVLAAKPEASECADPPVKPKPRSISQPAYTAAAREAAVEGRVRVEVTVDETGRVTAARLLAGLGYGLDEAALAAAKGASFEAGTRCGKPVRATFVIAMRFSL